MKGEFSMTEWRKFYGIKGISVSEDGKVRRDYDDKYMLMGINTKYLKIQKDKEKNSIIRLKDKGEVRVDWLVAKCFCHREDGQNYIIHKDRNKTNCHKNNLKWVTKTKYRNFHSSSLIHVDKSGILWHWSFDDFWVNEKGEVKKKNGNLMEIQFLISDLDVGCCRAIDPYIQETWDSHRYSIDELVADAMLPIPEGLNKPALLHIDKNFKNCEAKNLKWVEYDSQEYQSYIEKRQLDISTINLQYGPLP